MHFIQNSWFLTHWSILVILLALSVVFIAYVNNKSKLLKHAVVSCFIAIFLNIGQLISTQSLEIPKFSPNLINQEKEEVQAPQTSTMVKLIDLVLLIAKEKIQD